MPQKQKIGLWICTSLVVGNMIGSGVFLLPASLGVYGGISLLGWILTTAGAMLLAFVFARLSRMIPKSGGPYIYTRYGFGDFAGFLVAWGYWISILAGNAAIAVAFAGYAGVFWPGLAETPLLAALAALASIWLLTGINAMDIRHAGIMQLITTVAKLLPLVAIGVLGLFYFEPGHLTPFNSSNESTFSAITATAALTLWALLGLESATIPADNIENAKQTISRATIFGTLIAAVVYILGTLAVMGQIPPRELAMSTAPFADAAKRMWGAWAGYAVGLGAAISCFGALNGWILMQGQIPLATARDKLFPASFGRVSRTGTPVFGLVLSSILVTLLMAMNYTKGLVELFTFIILLATLTCLVPYIFCTMALLMLYIKEPQQFSGQRILGPALGAGLAFLYSLWAVAGSGRDTVYWGFLLILAGIPVYVWMKWKNAD